MKNLGKIFLILLTPIYIFASVVASVDSTTVTKGEYVTLNLNVSGENIQRPSIDSICGNDILSSGSQTSITMINGEYKKNYILSYKFMPLKSCIIEPIEIDINSKIEKSKSIKIEVTKQKVDKNSDFTLSLVSEKKEVLVGESFKVDLIFKQKIGADAVDSKFQEPKFKGFWIKGQSEQKAYKEGDFNIVKISYVLSAQREGNLAISPAKIAIAKRVHTRDSWGIFMQSVKWKTYFSNPLDISVKPLPFAVKYIGDFTISVDIDKTSIDKNEALNLRLKIVGNGNLEDMQSFKPTIDGVTVFDEKIVIKDNELTQKMAFISDNDFVIKPFILKYFDTKTKKVKTITTKEIKIDVKGAKIKEELVIKRDIPKEIPQTVEIKNNSISTIWAVSIFIIGLFVGILIMILKPWAKFKNSKKINLKDEKLLLIKLLPFKDDKEVQKIMDDLEENIYNPNSQKLDKKLLKECLSKYEITT
ncbi:MAG: BatD family protein [Campylobacterota bacterium]|nr:BatD family protein [Campylobacterota bacterium]